MNTKILLKCVEELNKETYSKEYVLGMLETLIEMSSDSQFITSVPFNNPTYATTNSQISRTESVSDEETNIPDFLRPGPTGKI